MSSSPASTNLAIWRSKRRDRRPDVSVSFRLDDYFCSECWFDLFQRHVQVKLNSISHKKVQRLDRDLLLRDCFHFSAQFFLRRLDFFWPASNRNNSWTTDVFVHKAVCIGIVRCCWKWFLVNLLIIHLVTHRVSLGSRDRSDGTRIHITADITSFRWRSTRGTVTKMDKINPKKNQ